jgi:ribulose-5-phosphate 4-epimerase/fuculose-1-phosphate aldolase
MEFQKTIEKYSKDLVNAWKILGTIGLVDTIFNHISCSVKDSKGNFQMLMNPSGILPHEISLKNLRNFPLKKYDIEDANNLGVIPDGIKMHSRIHFVRKKEGVIIHTHSPYSIAVGCSKIGLLALSQTAMEFVEQLKIFEYKGMFRKHDLDNKVSELALTGGCAFLRHHGILVIADSISEAFYLTYYLEEACKIQVLTLSQKLPTALPKHSIVKETQRNLLNDRQVFAKQMFDAFCRQLKVKNGKY